MKYIATIDIAVEGDNAFQATKIIRDLLDEKEIVGYCLRGVREANGQ